MTKRMGKHQKSNRVERDFYPTPYMVTEKLLSNCYFPGSTIWEPACGKGDISDVLLNKGFDVLSTDVEDYGYRNMDAVHDFLEDDPSVIEVDNIVTNPPYKHALEFIHKSLDLAKYRVAMLLQDQFIGGKKRYEELFSTHPPVLIIVFSTRIPYVRGGTLKSGSFYHCWYVWDQYVLNSTEPNFTHVKWVAPPEKTYKEQILEEGYGGFE